MPAVVLISASERREVLAERLRMQGYVVHAFALAADGARHALAAPPAAVVADLWMPGMSGVQLCRLLRAEPATENVPVILSGPEFGQRHKFWAEKAGAMAYVAQGRMGDLARALERAIHTGRSSDFYAELGDAVDIRDRMAAHLDNALFDSVLGGEVRALAACAEFDRLFDQFSQLASRVLSYRWLAIHTTTPARFGLHAHPARREDDEVVARQVLGVCRDARPVIVEDEDAEAEQAGPTPLLEPIMLGAQRIGTLAVACRGGQESHEGPFVRLLARELGGPLRIAWLVEESQRLSTVDSLTGLRNRRSLHELASRELSRLRRTHSSLCALLIDVDHFKDVNDRRGHASGDIALTAVARALASAVREVDLVGRWGGEEFVVVLPDTPLDGGRIVAGRLRAAIEGLSVVDACGEAFRLTASIGLASHRDPESLDALVDRADRAMYAAKVAGRNRVEVAE